MDKVSIPLEALAKALARRREKPTGPTPEERVEPSESHTRQEENMEQPLLPLEAFKALVNLLGKKTTEPLSTDTKLDTNHIVDITDQYVGKSLIITGAARPKKPLTPAEREEALRKAMKTATEKPEE
jgi:hypothetical protein